MKILSSVLGIFLVITAIMAFSLHNANAGLKASLLEADAQIQDLSSELNDKKQALVDSNHELGSVKSQLADTNTLLASAKYDLLEAQKKINDNKISIDTLSSKLATTSTQLATTSAQLATTETQLVIATSEKSQFLSDYANLRSKINVRFGASEKDRRSFLTPDDPAVSKLVSQITFGYSEDNNQRWQHYEALYRWVVNNIEYSSDTRVPVLPLVSSGEIIWKQEYWRTPAETIKDKTGDCEDMALLLMSMLMNYDKGKFDRFIITLASTTPGEAGHMAMAFPVQGGRLTILDPAGKYYTGRNLGYLSSVTISAAVTDWLNHWRTQIPGVYVDRVFNDKLDMVFSNTAEFISWAQAQSR